jgi:hypothetical protein
MAKKTKIDRAAERIVDILDSTLAGLPETEQKRRMNAFSAVVAKMDARSAKSEGSPRTPASPRSPREHEVRS